MICRICRENEATVKVTMKCPTSRPVHRMICTGCAEELGTTLDTRYNR